MDDKRWYLLADVQDVARKLHPRLATIKEEVDAEVVGAVFVLDCIIPCIILCFRVDLTKSTVVSSNLAGS